MVVYALSKVSSKITDYEYMYQQSVKEPEKFWSVQARKFLVWDQTFTKVNDCQKEEGIVKWFTGGKLNVSSEYIRSFSAFTIGSFFVHTF